MADMHAATPRTTEIADSGENIEAVAAIAANKSFKNDDRAVRQRAAAV